MQKWPVLCLFKKSDLKNTNSFSIFLLLNRPFHPQLRTTEVELHTEHMHTCSGLPDQLLRGSHYPHQPVRNQRHTRYKGYLKDTAASDIKWSDDDKRNQHFLKLFLNLAKSSRVMIRNAEKLGALLGKKNRHQRDHRRQTSKWSL